MPTDIDLLDNMSSLLAHVVDSFEKLEIVVHLYERRFTAQRALTIGNTLALPPGSVAEALAALLRAGVVRTHEHDGAGWWLDQNSTWATSVEVLVDLYQTDRPQLLDLMKRVALDAMLVQPRVSAHHYVVRRRRRPGPPS